MLGLFALINRKHLWRRLNIYNFCTNSVSCCGHFFRGLLCARSRLPAEVISELIFSFICISRQVCTVQHSCCTAASWLQLSWSSFVAAGDGACLLLSRFRRYVQNFHGLIQLHLNKWISNRNVIARIELLDIVMRETGGVNAFPSNGFSYFTEKSWFWVLGQIPDGAARLTHWTDALCLNIDVWVFFLQTSNYLHAKAKQLSQWSDCYCNKMNQQYTLYYFIFNLRSDMVRFYSTIIRDQFSTSWRLQNYYIVAVKLQI